MNSAIEKLIAAHDLAPMMKVWREKMRQPQYNDVLDHLMGFTGLDEDEVVFRCMKKQKYKFGSRGWFHDEWRWADPCGDREIDWYYRMATCYLFSNSRREPWDDLVDDVGEHSGPVLEFGCGIGHNLKPLIDKGVGCVAFYEHSYVQHAFVKYRIERLGLRGTCPSVALPGIEWAKCVHPESFNTIVLQDVLEHMPAYEGKLNVLIRALRTGGRIYERSPFTPKGSERLKKVKPFHVVATTPVAKVMKAGNMKLVRKGDDGTCVWQKGS